MCNCGSGWIRTHSSLRLSEPKAKTPPYISTPSDILGTKCWAHLDSNQGRSPDIFASSSQTRLRKKKSDALTIDCHPKLYSKDGATDPSSRILSHFLKIPRVLFMGTFCREYQGAGNHRE